MCKSGLDNIEITGGTEGGEQCTQDKSQSEQE